MSSPQVVQVTDENFESTVTASPLPVLIDFWGDWCPPCMQIAPAIDVLASRYAGRFQVAKAKIDEARKAAVRFRVSAVPTLIVLRNGQPVETMIGAQSLERLTACLDRHLSTAGVSEISRASASSS